MTDQARRAKRYPINQGLSLRCDDWNEFVQYYASDISQGGLFIVTERELPIMSVVEVRLDLPEGHQIPLKARVVHVLDKSMAEAEGTEAGVGVEFLDMDGAHRNHIQQLVDFARWEGTAGTGTYASHMFDRAATHQTLTDVVLSLPPQAQTSGAPAVLLSTPTPAPTPAPTPQRAVVSEAPKRKRKRKRRTQDAARETGEFPTDQGASAGASPEEASGKPAPKPSDRIKLKAAMTHFAHRRYAEAVAGFKKMDEENPGDVEANKWMFIAHARIALANGTEDTAIEYYEKALVLDENNHEARRFVREQARNKKLSAIPFGHLFKRRNSDS